ncbi:hypothetical protein B0H14DRAFT_3152540 [Mycena olivaceomarginata]|nr:hypothetical protein B0H14DRAFT_3152540 [Mycena olivaceomarginata]
MRSLKTASALLILACIVFHPETIRNSVYWRRMVALCLSQNPKKRHLPQRCVGSGSPAAGQSMRHPRLIWDSHCTTPRRTRETRSTYLSLAPGIPATTRFNFQTPGHVTRHARTGSETTTPCADTSTAHTVATTSSARVALVSDAAAAPPRSGMHGEAGAPTIERSGPYDWLFARRAGSSRTTEYRMRPLLKACVHSTNPQS